MKNVSILMCSYNAKDFIKNTLDTLVWQDYKDIEILILDNNSKDNTIQILRKYEKRYSHIHVYQQQQNLGAYGGLNFLLDKASGKYIAIQDHDDLRHPKKISTQVEFLEKNKGYHACWVNIINYYEEYNIITRRDIKNQISKYVAHPGIMYKNTKLRYNLSEKVHIDRVLMIKQFKNIYLLEKKYLLHRIRKWSKNLSFQRNRNFQQNFNHFKEGIISLTDFIHMSYSSLIPKVSIRLSAYIFSKNRKKINKLQKDTRYKNFL